MFHQHFTFNLSKINSLSSLPNQALLFELQLPHVRASLMFQWVKKPPESQEAWVQSLGREDPLEKEMATHSSTFAWKIPQMEETGRPQSMGLQRVKHD